MGSHERHRPTARLAVPVEMVVVVLLPSLRPMSMWWERMTGLNLILAMSQYSRASMFTLRWSMPSWQMSA